MGTGTGVVAPFVASEHRAAEAGLVAGLTAVGGPAGPVIAGVLTFRLLTFWLPVLPGCLVFRALRARGTV